MASTGGFDVVFASANVTTWVNVDIVSIYATATLATGSVNDDILYANNALGAVTLDAGAGNDTLLGSGFNDTLNLFKPLG